MKIIPLWKALSKNNIGSWPDVISGLGIFWSDSVDMWMPVSAASMVVEGKKYKWQDRTGKITEFTA